MARLHQFEVFDGTTKSLSPVRAFADGQLFMDIEVHDNAGRSHHLHNVFCTSPLIEAIYAPSPKKIYVWNHHIIAIEAAGKLNEDIQGVRRSYLCRDRFLLMILAGSIIMLPYAAWILAKKIWKIGTLPEVKDGAIVS